MKDGMDSTAVRRAPDTEAAPAGDGFSNRKLIRPSLGRENGRPEAPVERRDRPERPAGMGRKMPPPETTHAENFYYQKQMQTRTPMVIVLKDGEQLRGVIEWYDKECIKITRTPGQSNLLVYKPSIKYIFKEAENGKR
jgi:host factor-I protein